MKRLFGGIFFLIFFITPVVTTQHSWADADYKFVDELGNAVEVPENLPVYSTRSPGPWKQHVTELKPKLDSWVRNDGLEDIRVITLKAMSPFEKDGETHSVKAFYLLDKDGLIVGYHSFGNDYKGPAHGKFFINGIINYVLIYTEYENLGLWKQEIVIPFKK